MSNSPIVAPETYPFAPRPEAAQVSREQRDDGSWSSSVARRWAEGDGERCRLCPRHLCGLQKGLCLVRYEGYVTDSDAAFHPMRTAPGGGNGYVVPGGVESP